MFGFEDEPPGAVPAPSTPRPSVAESPPFPAAAAAPARYGGFWRRFAAAFLDGLILWAVGFGAKFLMRMSAGVPIGSLWKPSTGAAPLYSCAEGLVLLVVGWIYGAGLESSVKQATLGKMALEMRVTDLAGRRISFGRATGRHFGKYLSALFLGIGFLMVGFSQMKQGLHDMMAGTLVVRD